MTWLSARQARSPRLVSSNTPCLQARPNGNFSGPMRASSWHQRLRHSIWNFHSTPATCEAVCHRQAIMPCPFDVHNFARHMNRQRRVENVFSTYDRPVDSVCGVRPCLGASLGTSVTCGSRLPCPVRLCHVDDHVRSGASD